MQYACDTQQKKAEPNKKQAERLARTTYWFVPVGAAAVEQEIATMATGDKLLADKALI